MELSKDAKFLLDKLVADLKSKLSPEERIIKKEDAPALIYNLFRGKYDFSYKNSKEIIIFLTNKKWN